MAYDPDGDIITYELIPCAGYEGDPLPGYIYPEDVFAGPDTFTIDEQTGDVVWQVPGVVGEYNIAIRIEEWRSVNGTLIKVGEVVRDMQIDVEMCSNQPPVLDPVADTCIVSGSLLNLIFHAEDPDGQSVSLTAVGGPLSEVENPAVFSDLGGGVGQFIWSPECAEIRAQPYGVLVQAEDDSNQVPLSDLETVQVRVIATAVEGLTAEPVGNAVLLDWAVHVCLDELPDWKADAIHYEVYRRVTSSAWEPDYCETGIPGEAGYSLIGSVEGLSNTGFVDDALLSYGATYCYRLVAVWPDGGESLASEEFCVTILKDIPVMTVASVESTSATAGTIAVGWSPPTDADTTIFTAPYFYRLYGGDESGSTDLLRWESEPGPFLSSPDTGFVDTERNTEDVEHAYRVECWSEAGLLGSSNPASTPWLTLEPQDNALALRVTAVVPWVNESYSFFRQNPAGDFELLASTTEPFYVDTGLVNNTTYCYKVETRGDYDAPGVLSPLVNWSHEVCGRPFDYTAPCAPDLSLMTDCAEETNAFSWTMDSLCGEDVMAFQLYWAPIQGQELLPIVFLEDPENGTYIWNEDGQRGTLAGCFALTALDSLQPGPDGALRRNESALSDTLCADNCPYYFLPNVFSPNHDDMNDLFSAFPYKFVDSVDFRAFNRYGELVFRTDDPQLNWNGSHREGGWCSDGVYFYTVRVFTPRLVGTVEEKFSGEIHLQDGSGPTDD